MIDDNLPVSSNEMKCYFENIKKNVNVLYKIAGDARKKGIDPVLEIECPQAHDMAGRVENLVGPLGVAKRIRELKKANLNQDQIAFKICDEILEGKLGNFSKEEKIDRAIRSALAIKTEGVVSAPLEGISEIKIREDPLGGPPYLSLYFAGPIRASGGTVQAFAVLVADYVADKMKIAPWIATNEEIGRFVEEIKLYDQTVHLQYPSTKEQIEFAVKNLRIEINGEPTETREVSAYRNLKRIETNFIRSGPCLVLNDGILLKSKKILGIVNDLNLKGWDWLKEIENLSFKEDGTQKNSDKELDLNSEDTPVTRRRKILLKKIPPKYDYIADVIAGRPVFAYPSYIGAHRIRYGRSRNTGLAACGMNPNTMYILNEFIGIGTQLKIERPGKATVVSPVTSIEGPVCLLSNGDVVQFNEVDSYKIIKNNPIKKILFLGDILLGYGEFNANKTELIPSGYVEEWWSSELESILYQKNIVEPTSLKSYNLKYITFDDLNKWIKNPFNFRPSGIQCLELCNKFQIPLHPAYTFHYGNVNGIDLLKFRNEIINYYNKINKNFGDFTNLQIPNNEICRNFLYNIYCPHKNKGEYLELSDDLTVIFIEIFALNKKFKPEEDKEIWDKAKQLVALDVFPLITTVKIMDKSPYYIGSRMGRPEKANERKMKPPVHLLFPLGHDTDNMRVFQSEMENFNKEVEIVLRECPKCLSYTFENFCRKCNLHTNLKKFCPSCKRTIEIVEEVCPICGSQLATAVKRKINISNIYKNFIERLKITKMPIIKAVKGLSSEFKMPEPIEKGILRALNEIWVFKDGTIRFDAIDIPLTHFTPKEIETPINKLKELGYKKDYLGYPLEREDQICELKVQDILVTHHCADYFFKVAKFVDDELEFIYNLPRFYNLKTPNDIIGHYIAGLAPHTSAAIVGRIIGFTSATACYAHPFWHAAKRRNCDGDEDGIILLLDLLLNFSRYYLPSKIGGKMDAPLVLSVILDPNEIDNEAFNIDTTKKYPIEFYLSTLKYTKATDLEKQMDIVNNRLNTPKQYEELNFTIPTLNINYGPCLSSYKRLESMDEKIELQLDLAIKIASVNAEDAVRKMLQSHFTPDILGNLKTFATQNFRCTSCQQKYRRPTLTGKCYKCGGNLILTVSKGNIIKYLNKALKLIQQFELGNYTTQRMKLIEEYVQSLTDNPKIKQKTIMDFYS